MHGALTLPVDVPWLSIMVFVPLVGMLLVAVLGMSAAMVRWLALATVIINLVVAVLVTLAFDREPPKGVQYQFTENLNWISGIGAKYHLGVDGVSMLMEVLTALLMVAAVLASWNAIQTRVKEYYMMILLLNVGLMGVFVALDFFLFYIFWELVLFPMAILIGVWGGQRRVYAAIKFFLYTFVASVFMLIALIAVYFQYTITTGLPATLDIPTITDNLRARGGLPTGFQFWAFLAFGIAFAVKVPLWPFHTWLPDAHTEAPTAGSVILAGSMLKMGTYGFIRFNLPLFPDASRTFAPIIMTMSIIAIIYGALTAMAQPDMKKLIAYSSVSHMGYVMLGLFSFALSLDPANRSDILVASNNPAFTGAVVTMFSHGLLTGGLFLGVGVIYERLHTRDIKTIQQALRISSRMPMYAVLFMFFTLGSLGLPGISGFVGEFLVLQGSFRVNGWAAVGGSMGVILGAVYMLWLYKRVFFGYERDYNVSKAQALTATAAAHGGGHGASGHETPAHGGQPSPDEGQGSSHGATVDSHAAHSNQASTTSEPGGHGGHDGGGHGGHHDPNADWKSYGAKLPDINISEFLAMVPLVVLALLLGIIPSLMIDFMTRPQGDIIRAMVENSTAFHGVSSAVQTLIK